MLISTALVQQLNTNRKMAEWREAQQQRLKSADAALETASARLQQKARDIQASVSILQRWLDDQQQSHDSNGALSAGTLSLESAIPAAHVGLLWLL